MEIYVQNLHPARPLDPCVTYTCKGRKNIYNKKNAKPVPSPPVGIWGVSCMDWCLQEGSRVLSTFLDCQALTSQCCPLSSCACSVFCTMSVTRIGPTWPTGPRPTQHGCAATWHSQEVLAQRNPLEAMTCLHTKRFFVVCFCVCPRIFIVYSIENKKFLKTNLLYTAESSTIHQHTASGIWPGTWANIQYTETHT